jgi:hypothetical protein
MTRQKFLKITGFHEALKARKDHPGLNESVQGIV